MTDTSLQKSDAAAAAPVTGRRPKELLSAIDRFLIAVGVVVLVSAACAVAERESRDAVMLNTVAFATFKVMLPPVTVIGRADRQMATGAGERATL